MRTWFFLILAIVSAGLAAAEELSIRHLGEGPADRVLHCIDSVTAKHTLVYDDFVGDFARVRCDPHQSKEEVVKNFEAQGFHLLANDRWSFLVPHDLFIGKKGFKVAWAALNVDTDVVVATDQPQEPVSEKEIATLKEELINETRLIPVQADTDSVPASMATVHLQYNLYSWKNKKGNVAVAALLHEGENFPTTLGTFGRLIYGEVVGGEVRLLWDSPLAFASNLTLTDIDGDGNNEIILRGTLGFGAHGPGLDTIVVFNRDGREVTRQENCGWMDQTELQSGADRVCPIAGSEVALQTRETGPIIQAADAPDYGNVIYVFKAGHFVLDRAHVKRL